MLQQDGVAHDEGWDDGLEGQPEGEVPWHDHEGWSEGLVRDDSTLVRIDNIELFIGKPAR